MGLTISYKFRLETDSLDFVREKMKALYGVAQDLPFAELSELVEFEGEDCCFIPRENQEDPHRWLKLDAAGMVQYDRSYVRVNALRTLAFSTWPGKGCETATFGLSLYPESIAISLEDIRENQKDFFFRDIVGLPAERQGEIEGEFAIVPTNLPSWSWSSFCKTQYASNPEYGGVEHFLKCHGLVIKILETARDLGLLAKVCDEGGYWEHRDLQKLAASVGHYNALVAGVVGGLGDLFNNSGIVTESYAPIAEFPNYEYLEAEGEQQLGNRERGIGNREWGTGNRE